MTSDDTQLIAVRQHSILELINQKQSAKLTELCKTFSVSVATIRRDLASLEKRGEITRTHGGAMTNMPVSKDFTNEDRSVSNVVEKARIGKAIVHLFTGDKTVFLDSGTTAVEIAKCIPVECSCKFVTNSLSIAAILKRRNADKFYLVGGAYGEVNDSFGGSIAISTIRSMSFDLAVLCVSAIDVERQQISVGNEAYSQVQKEIIGVSRQNYIAADLSKFRASAFICTASFEQLDGIVTNDGLNSAIVEQLKASGLDLIIG